MISGWSHALGGCRVIENATLILGPPGCGKTHYLLDEVERALEQGVRPHEIVFVSFTRKSIQEAVSRACVKFALSPKDFPFFRTMHSLSYHAMGLQTTDVMTGEDYAIVGRTCGLVLNGTKVISPDDGQIIPAYEGSGMLYLQLLDRSRYRKVSLDKEFNDASNWDLSYPMLVKVAETLSLYKQANTKFDFVDMIETYIDRGEPPRSKLLIIDEAQDLTPLQWDMAHVLGDYADKTLIAGDDDQSIYGFSGTNVRDFITSAPNRMVLSQSYRLPRRVWDLSRQVASRISGRIEKEFFPRDEEGDVQWHMSLDTIPFNNGESWTFMSRVNRFMYGFAQRLEEEGYVYSIKGRSSINQDVAAAILHWRALQAGEGLWLRQVVELYKMLPKAGPAAALRRGATKLLDAADPEARITYQELRDKYGLLAPLEHDALDVVRMGDDERVYIAAAERRGVDITAEPKIKLGTFHSMKGGQDDNCVVYLGSTKACADNDPDEELRALYVAITRAKQTLHLLDTDKKYRIEL